MCLEEICNEDVAVRILAADFEEKLIASDWRGNLIKMCSYCGGSIQKNTKKPIYYTLEQRKKLDLFEQTHSGCRYCWEITYYNNFGIHYGETS